MSSPYESSWFNILRAEGAVTSTSLVANKGIVQCKILTKRGRRMTRKTLKKRRIRVNLPGGMAIYSEEGVIPWSDFLEEWKSAANKPLPEGSGAPTVLAWIDNMGDIGRKKGRSSKGDEDNFPPKITTIPEYLHWLMLLERRRICQMNSFRQLVN